MRSEAVLDNVLDRMPCFASAHHVSHIVHTCLHGNLMVLLRIAILAS